MSDIISKKMWEKWYPEELDSSKSLKKTTDYVNKDELLKKKSVSTENNDIKTQENYIKESEKFKNNFPKNVTKVEEDSNFEVKKTLLELKKQKQIIQKKIHTFLSDFEKELDSLDKVVSTHVINLSLKITAKILGKNPLIKTSFILNKIKEIIKLEPIHFCKPKLIIHPDDFDVIKKHFGEIFNIYGWSILCDNNINLGGCKIESEDSNIDITISTLWRELCRMSLSNEYY